MNKKVEEKLDSLLEIDDIEEVYKASKNYDILNHKDINEILKIIGAANEKKCALAVASNVNVLKHKQCLEIIYIVGNAIDAEFASKIATINDVLKSANALEIIKLSGTIFPNKVNFKHTIYDSSLIGKPYDIAILKELAKTTSYYSGAFWLIDNIDFDSLKINPIMLNNIINFLEILDSVEKPIEKDKLVDIALIKEVINNNKGIEILKLAAESNNKNLIRKILDSELIMDNENINEEQFIKIIELAANTEYSTLISNIIFNETIINSKYIKDMIEIADSLVCYTLEDKEKVEFNISNKTYCFDLNQLEKVLEVITVLLENEDKQKQKTKHL